MLTVEQMMQKLLRSQAPSFQMAREDTSAHAKILLILETVTCFVPFTTGSVQPEIERTNI